MVRAETIEVGAPRDEVELEAYGHLATHAFSGNPPAAPEMEWIHELGRENFLVARVDGQVVGYAIYFFTYSTFRARPTLYLEDIFVLPEQRGHGAGIALFRTCAREAVANECARMEWQVLAWNEPSIAFYERLGARHMADWLPFRLDDEALLSVGTPRE